MIQKETGWTDEYLLWGISWANVQMKLRDAPYYKYRSGKGKDDKVVDQKGLEKWLHSIEN
jgi:hypothetical protein